MPLAIPTIGKKQPFFISLFLPLFAFSEGSYAEHETIFTRIYSEAVWGTNEEGLGFSGGGSLSKNTLVYRGFLQEFIREHNIKTVIDVGCGDWEFSRYIDWSNVHYTGYDVVAPLIERDRERYGAPNIQFIHANFLDTDLPPADLILCKHVLQHLSNADIEKFLEQLPKFTHCLLTNQVELDTLLGDNADIPAGDCHKLNLSEPPFSVRGETLFVYYCDGSAHQVFYIPPKKSEPLEAIPLAPQKPIIESREVYTQGDSKVDF